MRTPDRRRLNGAALFGSGRDALVALARWGASGRGWRRLWLPSYTCPEVPAALLAAAIDGLELRAYDDAGLTSAARLDHLPAAAGDVVVLVNQLGIRPRPETGTLRRRGAVIVEDHSHDLGSTWARESDADYAFASLRKTLPLPDGGAAWSPRGHELPPEPSAAERASRLADGLAHRGAPVGDARLRYLALARAAAGADEPRPGGSISAVSRALLPQMPLEAWRERRRANLEILAHAVSTVPGVRVLEAPPGGVAFALTLLFDDAVAREDARRALIARAVNPVVLWPLDPARDWGAGLADADASARILSVHGDQRFDGHDMRRLAVVLRAALGG